MEHFSYDETIGNWHLVKKYRKAGLNIMPLRVDGSKAPKITWAGWQLEKVPSDLLEQHFRNLRYPSGIGVICGITSGWLEILDFDGPHLFAPWHRKVAAVYPDLVQKLVIVKTPKGGFHLYYRCMQIDGNLKLAYDQNGAIQIETRGQGGQAVMPGSPNETHITGRPYRLAHGSLEEVKVIGIEHRRVLLEAARSFDLRPKSTKTEKRVPGDEIVYRTDRDRPGDDFNARAKWEDILEPAGWRMLREVGGVEYWQRPGKTGPGPSASVGHCRTDDDRPLLHVFSSNASPFESESTYDKFAAYTLLYHQGDYHESARALASQGYGRQDIMADLEQKIKALYGA